MHSLKTGRLVIVFFTLGLWITFSSSPIAAQSPKPIFPITTPAKKELEKTYLYSIMKYSPQVKVQLMSSPDQASYKTPEEAIVSFYSAAYTLDYNWHFKSWTQRSKAYIREQVHENLKSTPEVSISRWRRRLADTRVELTRRVNRGRYVIIESKIISSKDDTKTSLRSSRLEMEDGAWKITQALRHDPVAALWNRDLPTSRGAVSYKVHTLSEVEKLRDAKSINKLPKPIFPTTKPVYKKLVRTYRYSVMQYTPAAKIDLLGRRKEASYATPEDTVIAHLSAMYAGDFDWYLEGWTKDSQRDMKNDVFRSLAKPSARRLSLWDRYFGKALEYQWYFEGWSKKAQMAKQNPQRKAITMPPEEMVAAWKNYLRGTRAELTRRAEWDKYVLVEYAIVSKKDRSRKFVFSLPLEQKGLGWKLTLSQFLMITPVPHWWNKEDEARKNGYVIRGR